MIVDTYERSSDPCPEAPFMLVAKKNTRYNIVLMEHGDELMSHPDMIIDAVKPMLDNTIIALLGEINGTGEFEDRKCINVVSNLEFYSKYFQER